jgi:hypothetical protein
LFVETGDIRNDVNRKLVIGDPALGTGEYGLLWNEADENGALGGDNSVDLGSCAGWDSPLNCESLRRVEARFGDGDGEYTVAEQERALNTFYDSFLGSWRFFAPRRQVRLGFELRF